MPDIRNCRRCNKIFNYIGGLPICYDCKKQDEINFKRVKEYLYEHPGASLYEVSKELEISVQQIKVYLKEGRLEIVGESGNMFLECEKCGKSITTGRFCKECANEVANDIKSVVSQMSTSAGGNEARSKREKGMRYLTKDDE